MHYENGHEVAQQLAREVHQIAFSPTKAWTRRNSTEETYICELGGMIALKLHAVFDCSPDTLLSVILNHQMEWDMNLRSQEILEEYDLFNKIKLQKYVMPVVGKMVCMCLYTCVIANQPNQYFIVYQSIDHERIPPYEPVVTVFPSGFFLSPVPGNPRKCHLTSVFQFQADSQQNPKIVVHLCTSSERIIAGLQGVLLKEGEGERWETIVNHIRRDLYNTMHGLEPANGWSLRFQRAGMRTYTKQNSHEFRVATRTAFSLPYKCHEVVYNLFTASQKGTEWDQFVEHAGEPVFLGPNTFLQAITYGNLQDGTTTKGYMLVNINVIKDNVCDMTMKISYNGPPVSFGGWLHTFMSLGGFIIYPSPDNPKHSTVQCVVDTPHAEVCSDEGLKRESLRIHYYLNALVGYITQRLHETVQEGVGDDPPRLTSVIDLPRQEMPYATMMEAFSKMLVNEPSIFKGPPESPRSTRDTLSRNPQSKRKHLMNVDDVVFSNPKSISSASSPVKLTKPFLFLVSDDGTNHRFLRRRLESPIVQSKFDALPQEIMLEIFKRLDSIALNNIACTCTHFKELVTNCQLWRSLYDNDWGDVRGRVARRYCGDDDPTTFFSTFMDWKELYLERQYIEAAWEAPERRALSFTVSKAHTRSVQSMALLPYRHRLVTGSRDRLVRVWDVTSGACLLKLHGTAACVAVSPWGDTHVKVGYKDGAVHTFDVVREECTSEVRLGEIMRGCIFANKSIISWSEQIAIHWDETTQQRIASFAGHLQRIKSCAICPIKSILFTASRDSTVRLWDLHNRTKISTIDGHVRSVNAVGCWGDLCVTGSSDKTVKVWDMRKLDSALHTLTAHTGKVTCLNYTEIGNKMCTGGEDGVNIWNSTNFTHMRKDQAGEFVTSIAMDEESLAFGGLNGEIQYYDFTPHR